MEPQTPTTSSSPGSEAPSPYVQKANEYIAGVLSGAIPACKWVRLACERQRDDLIKYADHDVFHFDVEKASRVCRFIERLPHIKGPAASRKELIRLEPWQCFILTTVFGWRRKDTGGRRFRRCYVEVPRGNGKSILSSCIALYGLCADGEEGAEVYSAATTRDQAKFVWGVAQAMLLKRPEFAKKIGAVVNRTAILKPSTNSTFVPLSREAKNQDGANLHVGIVDELHAHRTREVYDVLETAMAKRLASMLFVITTAGFDTAGICYEVRTYATRVLERKVDDDTAFGIIYSIDLQKWTDSEGVEHEADDWTQPASWVKANPNWGISVMPDEVAALAKKAIALPSAAANFQTKHLNVWCNAAMAWMDMRAWDRCADPTLNPDDFADDDCFGGLDLAARVDIAAKVRLFRRMVEGVVHFYGFLESYLPEAAIENSKNSQYGGWVAEGRIKATPGDVIDFDAIKDDVLTDSRQFRLLEVTYDPWQAQKLANELTDAGLAMVELRPNVQNFSEPMKEWDALVRTGRFHHDGNPVFRWMVSNVVAKLDAKDNIFPIKERPENKIDGPVAMLSAFNRALLSEPGGSYLEDQPLVAL